MSNSQLNCNILYLPTVSQRSLFKTRHVMAAEIELSVRVAFPLCTPVCIGEN